MFATDLAAALDPAHLAERAGYVLDDWQAAVLRSEARQTLLNCCRQSGKSLTTALLALHTAVYRAPALALILSPTERQSAEMLRTVRSLVRAVPAALVAEESTLRLELVNGSRIVALPGGKESNIRGFSNVALVAVDEASRCDDGLYQAIRPMLGISGGRLVLLSTPFGQRGFFHHEWTEGGPDWQRVKVTAAQCPRIDPQWLAAERLAIGPWWASQEWSCEFVQTSDTVFGYEDVMGALSADVRPLFGAQVEVDEWLQATA